MKDANREWRKASARLRKTGPWCWVRIPALVLVGNCDLANLGPSTGLATALPHGQLQVVSRAGTGWPRTQPDRCAELIRSYLAGLD